MFSLNFHTILIILLINFLSIIYIIILVKNTLKSLEHHFSDLQRLSGLSHCFSNSFFNLIFCCRNRINYNIFCCYSRLSGTISSICARFASDSSAALTTTSAPSEVRLTTASLNPFDASIVSAAASFSARSVIKRS